MFHTLHTNYKLKLPPHCNFRANFLRNRIRKNQREISNKLTVYNNTVHNDVIFRILFQLTLYTTDTHPNISQHDFSSIKLYISPIILTLLTIFSINQVSLPHTLFPHINITYILYLLYLNLPIPFQAVYIKARNM
jgi:hypothetical protein